MPILNLRNSIYKESLQKIQITVAKLLKEISIVWGCLLKKLFAALDIIISYWELVSLYF
jgi:hypothetical protein